MYFGDIFSHCFSFFDLAVLAVLVVLAILGEKEGCSHLKMSLLKPNLDQFSFYLCLKVSELSQDFDCTLLCTPFDKLVRLLSQTENSRGMAVERRNMDI